MAVHPAEPQPSRSFTLAEAAALGIGRNAVRRLVATGLAVVTRSDQVVMDQTAPPERLALAGLGPGVVLSLESAAVRYGWPVTAELLHLAVPRTRTGVRWPGTSIHSRSLAADQIVAQGGLPTTTVETTILDLARWRGVQPALRCLDAARAARQTYPRRIRRAIEKRAGEPGVRNAKLAEFLSSEIRQSPLESDFRLLVHQAGLPPPVDQYVIRRAGRFLGRADFVWPEAMLVVEIDGYAFHREYGAFQDDHRRDREMHLAGWLVLRFTAADLEKAPEAVIAEVREALQLRGLDV